MNSLSADDLAFEREFASGELPPARFDHRAHLRLAYVHLATHGPVEAVGTFRDALQAFLHHHRIDPAKYHETLTQAWLQAAWHFMQRCAPTADGEEFLRKCTRLHDPRVMLTHYTQAVLYSEEARHRFAAPDLDPIPRGGEVPGG